MQYVDAHLFSHLTDTLYTGTIQMTIVLARLDEPMALDVLLHLFPWRNKVIVPPIHLVLPLGPCGVCQAKNKTIKAARTLTPSLTLFNLFHFQSTTSLERMYYADITLEWLQVAAVTSN